MALPVLQALAHGMNRVLGVVYPEVCDLCGKEPARPEDSYVCRECRKDVRPVEYPVCDRCGRPFEGEVTHAFECSNCRDVKLWFDKARSAVEAKGKVLQAIHRYKYNRALWLEPFLADLLVGAVKQGLPAGCCDQIVPVPLFSTKQRERGFNQAERLARRLSKGLGVPLNSRAIKRVLPTPSQTHLGRLQRQENMNGAFAIGAGGVTDAKVLLVDDVFTTGATTNACACMLRKAGASAVYVWTLARGI